ncbi:MAG: UDP-glucose 6-dehydrogenase [Geobacillus sp.]|uniref:Negative regulator of sigma-X activity n=1 Tax=Geobacillus sp. (strain Y4.1MC1) TaxID=581103 RepID=A0A7U3YE31_GEOS0|nr:MAG: UDP-glucose 6-dehydrogenase [Geobacillus sp.]
MKKFPWNDECIQHALQQLPMIKDHRSKEEVYRQLVKARKIARLKAWFLPSLASVIAAMLVVALSVPDFPMKRGQEEKAEKADKPIITLQAEEHSGESRPLLSVNEYDDIPSRIVTEEALNGQNIVVVGLPDAQSQVVIPLSVPVRKYESVKQQLETAKTKIDEQIWGVSKRLLNGVTMEPSRDNKQVWTVRVSKQHPVFSEGLTSETMFLSSIEETVRWMGGKKIRFFTENKEGVELSSSGYVRTLKLSDKKRAYYLYQQSPSHPVFLVPSPQRFQTFFEALTQMKKDVDASMRSAIPKGVHIEKVDVQQDNVAIRFALDSQLDVSPLTCWMVEAILLTAKEFGFRSVTLMGGNVKRIGPYIFGKKIAVPVGPNPIVATSPAR